MARKTPAVLMMKSRRSSELASEAGLTSTAYSPVVIEKSVKITYRIAPPRNPPPKTATMRTRRVWAGLKVGIASKVAEASNGFEWSTYHNEHYRR